MKVRILVWLVVQKLLTLDNLAKKNTAMHLSVYFAALMISLPIVYLLIVQLLTLLKIFAKTFSFRCKPTSLFAWWTCWRIKNIKRTLMLWDMMMMFMV